MNKLVIDVLSILTTHRFPNIFFLNHNFFLHALKFEVIPDMFANGVIPLPILSDIFFFVNGWPSKDPSLWKEGENLKSKQMAANALTILSSSNDSSFNTYCTSKI